jgi:hypothetical protein
VTVSDVFPESRLKPTVPTAKKRGEGRVARGSRYPFAVSKV